MQHPVAPRQLRGCNTHDDSNAYECYRNDYDYDRRLYYYYNDDHYYHDGYYGDYYYYRHRHTCYCSCNYNCCDRHYLHA